MQIRLSGLCRNIGSKLGNGLHHLRYADVLTLYAEAIVRNGNAITEEALGYLNQVRTRAGLEAYKMNDFTGPRDFLDKLLMERAHEFVFEGVRRQDLIRDAPMWKP